MTDRPEGTLDIRGSGAVLAVAGLVGLAASLILLLERIALLQNPFHVPSCTVNAVVDCGAVMTSAQSSLFGFPNPVLGVAAFPVVVTLGVAVLAGARPSRWLWDGLLLGVAGGLALVHWLVVVSVTQLGALCPWCMLVWLATVVVAAAAVTLRLRAGGRAVTSAPGAVAVAVWTLAVGAVVLLRFGADLWASA